MPVCQDFVPAPQDLPIVKDVCTTSESVSEVFKPFISEGLVSLFHDKVNSRKNKILRDTCASQSLLFADVLPFSENWVPRGSVVECLTRNPGVLGSILTGSSGFFRGSVLGQDTSEPSLVLVKPRKA